jgi:hypothetical protein
VEKEIITLRSNFETYKSKSTSAASKAQKEIETLRGQLDDLKKQSTLQVTELETLRSALSSNKNNESNQLAKAISERQELIIQLKNQIDMVTSLRSELEASKKELREKEGVWMGKMEVYKKKSESVERLRLQELQFANEEANKQTNKLDQLQSEVIRKQSQIEVNIIFTEFFLPI